MQLRAKAIGRLHSYYQETEFDAAFEVYFEEMMVDVAAQLFGGSGKQRVMFVIGGSNSGKTSLVWHHLFQREELKPFTNSDGEEISPVLRFDAPAKLTGKGLALAGLAALKYDVVARSLTEHELYALFVQQMIAQGKVIAHIDEMQQVVSETNSDKIQSVADIIKLMAQVDDYPIHLIFSGLPTVANFLSASRDAPNRDQQLSNRAHAVIELPTLSPTAELDKTNVEKALRGISHAANIQVGDDLDDDFLLRVMHAASYAFGSVIDLIKKAFINALTYNDATVTRANFAAAYSQWRGCLPEHNIITADDWKAIFPENSVSHVLAEKAKAIPSSSLGETAEQAGSTKKRHRGAR